MDKDKLLREISEAAAQRLILKDEVLRAYDKGQQPVSEKVIHSKSIAEIISYVGGGIVVLGIAIFIGQHWSELNTTTRIAATFGSGMAAYIVGALFSRFERFNLPAQVFFLISALTTPVGISIAFDSAGWDMGSTITESVLAGILFGAY
ncbi:MAG: hypothetical protein PHV55_09075, partial [Candidatus Omnitrophica bacterium]|nr:hypothetical protein [Candidatus Omnitrophota bacterium]